MTASTTGMADLTSSEDIRNIFITGLENAHALEKQAIQLMERQVERFENYPEMSDLLRRHITETEGQIRRLDEMLHTFGADRSILKDMATQFMANLAAAGHMPMADEVLKNTFANHAFENFEIASYKSLIVMAEASGNQKFIPGLQETLREEEKTAQAVYDMIEPITRKFLMRSAQGQKADR
ncbi:ferritin-like domain-containing protein [Microvirga sp. CF3016]|jgi:ferritin-like metal-binding protein YciE|uniref:ferritin-like domain-containing protein n=1 Tax=Microvirga sp. CF3016 TaxID=3110181 RepID=UPI002DEBF5CF|nr:ferritin-like domain-containing protein [Microvirga sp. CF3016]MEE1613051.1 ferritin-like domain-containing protein [Microvirga sp. CF3016]HEV2566223.1 ferritin-like domain-containing protein [Microvirga sp.]